MTKQHHALPQKREIVPDNGDKLYEILHEEQALLFNPCMHHGSLSKTLNFRSLQGTGSHFG